MRILFTVIAVAVFFTLIGLCVWKIVKSLRTEIQVKNLFSRPSSSVQVSEPFAGASYYCALLVYITKNSQQSEKILRSVFKNLYRIDWGVYCRSAEAVGTALNGDLMVECLASKIKKNNVNAGVIAKIFSGLENAEMFWNEMEWGTKPSVYLSELLNYTVAESELLMAYDVLGLDRSATMEQVKTAHRKLAAKYHPDRMETKKAPGSKKEQEAFMKIQQAYELICRSAR